RPTLPPVLDPALAAASTPPCVSSSGAQKFSIQTKPAAHFSVVEQCLGLPLRSNAQLAATAVNTATQLEIRNPLQRDMLMQNPCAPEPHRQATTPRSRHHVAAAQLAIPSAEDEARCTALELRIRAEFARACVVGLQLEVALSARRRRRQQYESWRARRRRFR